MESRPSAGRQGERRPRPPLHRRGGCARTGRRLVSPSSRLNLQEGEERRRERLQGEGKGEFEHPLTRSLPRVPSSFHPRLLVWSAYTHPRVSSPPIRMTQKPIQSRLPSVGGEPPSVHQEREIQAPTFGALDEHGPPTYPAAEQVHLQQRRGLLRRQRQGVCVPDARRRCDRGRRSERRGVRRSERGSCEADPLEAAVAPRAPGTRSEASGGRDIEMACLASYYINQPEMIALLL